ncbi:MAG: hypothetical protein NTV34_17195 [Proteobacteria bacterium]|nr:hypothetical protein [Pseudomonadota bacterium]
MERLDAVLDTVYLLFNEGYRASEGGLIVRRDICDESTRLIRLLACHPLLACTEVKALAALIF